MIVDGHKFNSIYDAQWYHEEYSQYNNINLCSYLASQTAVKRISRTGILNLQESGMNKKNYSYNFKLIFRIIYKTNAVWEINIY